MITRKRIAAPIAMRMLFLGLLSDIGNAFVWGKGSASNVFTPKEKRTYNQLVSAFFEEWELLDSNQRPPACKAGALNQLS